MWQNNIRTNYKHELKRAFRVKQKITITKGHSRDVFEITRSMPTACVYFKWITNLFETLKFAIWHFSLSLSCHLGVQLFLCKHFCGGNLHLAFKKTTDIKVFSRENENDIINLLVVIIFTHHLGDKTIDERFVLKSTWDVFCMSKCFIMPVLK